MSHVTRSILLACWWALGSALASVCVAATVSPSSLPTATATSTPGQLMWNLIDRPANVGDPYAPSDFQRLLAKNVKSNGDFAVESRARVPTKHGAVDAVIVREIPYSKLVSPWKKALRVVPLVGSALAIKEMLEEFCIRPTGIGAFEQCYETDDERPYDIGYYRAGQAPNVSQLMTTSQAQSDAQSVSASSGTGVRNFRCAVSSISQLRLADGTWHGQFICQYEYRLSGTTDSWQAASSVYSPAAHCNRQGVLSRPIPGSSFEHLYCSAGTIAGYSPIGAEAVDSAIDQFPSKHPDKLQQQVPKLWGDLHNLPEGTPLDQRSVDATGLSEPTITPKTPADASKAGPKTTETTSTGTKVTQETSTITYQGNTTTVINNTTVTNINNEGDVIDESTTSEQGPTDCEKNPSAIGCLELGEPPSGDIPRKDEHWEITAESLPGGACPGGFVWPVPGNPEFSWQPLCDQLPKVRAVVLVLASVLAAWIVVGGFQS